MLPAGLAERIAAAGIIVASEPLFVRERGERYRTLLSDSELERVYAFREMVDAGIQLAAGSDAPVVRPDPTAAIAAAVERTTTGGALLSRDQAVESEVAARWWTSGAAYAAFLESERGSIAAGKAADLVLFGADAAIAGGDGDAGPKAVWHRGVRVWPDTA